MSSELETKVISEMVKNIQTVLDDLCDYIGYEKIYFVLDNDDILISTKKIPNVCKLGMCQETEMIELLIQITLKIVDRRIQCSIVSIDETFFNCVKNNSEMIKKMEKILKDKYNKTILL